MDVENEGVSRHYQGEQAVSYVAARQRNPRSMGYALNLKHFLPHLDSTHTVLDFGCGNGGMLRLLNDHVREAHGLEVNPVAATMAEESGCRILRSLDELPAEPFYDRVVTNHVLEHIRDVCSTLERLRACIKPGGLLTAKLPIDDFRSAHHRRWSRDDPDHHLQTWTPRLFANVLHESGYEVRESRVLTTAWHPKLFPLVRLGIGDIAFWALAVLKRRRQLFAVGEVP